jgi:DNA polymerase/3'-5' exonuclease PolX
MQAFLRAALDDAVELFDWCEQLGFTEMASYVRQSRALQFLRRTESAEVSEPEANTMVEIKKNKNVIDVVDVNEEDDATVLMSDEFDDDVFDDVVFTLRPPPSPLGDYDDSVVPMSSLPNRSAVTPLRSASSQAEEVAVVSPPANVADFVRPSLMPPIVDEELAPLPVESPDASPLRPASPVREARDVDRDSASLSETHDYFIGKREQRALNNSSAYADTSQWRAQWRPEVADGDDELHLPLLADGSDDSQDVGGPRSRRRRRTLTTADTPSDLQSGAQHAWRRYQASVQPLNKQAEPTPQCHCGADAVKRIVKKNSLNFGREFWGCARSKQRCKFFEWGDSGRPWDEMSSEARREAYFENMKKTLACQTVLRPPEYKPENLNKNLTDILERMRSQYKAAGDQMRVLGYTKAINAIKRCRRRIVNADEARQLYGVGDRIATKIDEIIRTGQLRQADHAADCEEGRSVELFSKVWGAGPATVRRWFAAGYRTLDDLRAHESELTRAQVIGLRHFDDFQERIPRAEVGRIESIVARVCVRFDPGFIVIACGSFRRGKADCGDVDILVSHADGASHASILRPLLRKLSNAGYLTDTLTVSEASKLREDRKMAAGTGEVHGTQSSYHGVFRLLEPGSKHRRLDIICVPYNEMGCALLYFTGSDYFNRSMRHYAKQRGFSLSQHGIAPAVRTQNGKVKNHVGVPIPTPSELDVFNVLGLDFVEPEDRDPSR